MGRKPKVPDVKSLEKPLPNREDLLRAIQRVLDVAFPKFEGRNTKNSEKLSWGRLIVQAVSAGASVLKDAELDQLAQKIEDLREDLSISERLKYLEEKAKNDE